MPKFFEVDPVLRQVIQPTAIYPHIKVITMKRKTRPSDQSAQPSNPAKSKKKADSSEPIALQEAPHQNKLVQVHDLVGRCVLVVPAQLKQIIGDEAYELHMKDTEVHEVLFIVRQPTDIVYIRFPFEVLSAEPETSTAPVA